jgi:hydrogenase maturation protein HypF
VIRREIRVLGIVQGVGFRPFVYGLADRFGLTGWVLNDEAGVLLEVEGPVSQVDGFTAELEDRPPALAVVTALSVRNLEPVGHTEFKIIASKTGAPTRTTVPADAATCADCRREVLDPADRRYGYPFTNCTNCGPRFTIVRDIPYDRPETTMSGFPMCPTCSREYHDPRDRRFHAQPNACPDCGPAVRILAADGREIAGPADWLETAAGLLAGGQILAVKGLGGFHLACDAGNSEAVLGLRQRKHRPHRPFAVMARDMGVVRQFCQVSEAEERLLTSPAAPIVLLERRPANSVAEAVAPGLSSIGVMLPYTPLHLLLLSAGPPVLVMTSGNPRGLPLCTDEAEALQYLAHIADAFVIHNRPIHVPCDDSVVAVAGGEPFFLRRSRGHVPRPVAVTGGAGPAALGAGGEIKNAFCLLEGDRAVFSQHLGDMLTEESRANYLRALDHLRRLTGIAPSLVAYDLHPGYLSARLARELPLDGYVAVQHHHAHLAACMAENRLDGETIGLVLDGTGYGPDGAIWGFEVLVGGYQDYRRIAHLAYSPLPGGEAAIHRPLMAAAGLVSAHLGEDGLRRLAALCPEHGREIETARALMRAGLNCPPAGTAGRLFDGVSAMAGICRLQSYEGQAAIELGAGAVPGAAYPFELRPDGVLSPAPLLDALLADAARGMPARQIAGRFLRTVAAMAVAGAEAARAASGLNDVCLSGGTFQSAWLVEEVSIRLREKGFRVFRHRAVPPGDGGIGLGQAMIARRRWQAGCV